MPCRELCGATDRAGTLQPRTTHLVTSRRPRILAIANQKGGVGKTTTAVNLAASLAAAERRTLLVDMDPQANASSGVGVPPGTAERTIYAALIGSSPLADVLMRTKIETLDIAPSTQDLIGVEYELFEHDRGTH